MALNPHQFRFHLYHGTSASNLDDIYAHGLGAEKGESYLTSDPSLAEYYANNEEDPVVLTVAVRPRDLGVDWNSFDEPVHGYSDQPENRRGFNPSKLRHETKDWANSLRQTGAVLHNGVIKPEHIVAED
jgi:hypothetical protein